MNKIELHVKTKYSEDKDSTIDIETILWNAKENNERGMVFIDKDTIVAFPKIEKIYNKLCEKDNSFNNFKIGYGVQLTAIINNKEYEVNIIIKNNKGLKDIYKIMSLYLTKYNKKIPIQELMINKDNYLLGLILTKDNIKLDLSIFDYLEINNNIDISNIKDKTKIVYSNIPNQIFEGEIISKEILSYYSKININKEVRLYKDTVDTLKDYNNKNIVIDNSNMLFDKLDKITVNDNKFNITNVSFKEFELLVRNKFKRVHNNPTDKLINRLNQELVLIKELNYTYYYELLMLLTSYCRENKEYYQIEGYINNSLISYLLDITEIEPYTLPYELFFSEIPKIEIKVSPDFYHSKLLPFIINKLQNKLIQCSYNFKLNKNNLSRIIKNYEIKNKKEFDSYTKDYITSILNDISISKKDNINNTFLIIPNDKELVDYTAYEYNSNNKLMSTHYDYHDIENNLIKLKFILNDDIDIITKLINKTNKKIKFCNDKKVYNLFRNTEEFKLKFKYLDKRTGLLNISNFDHKELENKLINIPNIYLDDLINILLNETHGIITDDLYNELKDRSLEDKDIFNTINYLKSIKILIPKATLINKVRMSYQEMYYKLYYRKEYYEVLLDTIDYNYINSNIYKYNQDKIKHRYLELKEINRIDLTLEENEELKLLEILLEMIERNIKYRIINKKIIIEGVLYE